MGCIPRPFPLIADATAYVVRALCQQIQIAGTNESPVYRERGCRRRHQRRRNVHHALPRELQQCRQINENHAAVDAEIEGDCRTDVDWTLVMPVALNNIGDKLVKIVGLTKTETSMLVLREGCARCMVNVVTGELESGFNNRRTNVSH
jgi:hypothetical protein